MIEPLVSGRLIGGRAVETADVPPERERPVPTGISEIDLSTGGLPTGSVWTVAGPAGVGVSGFVTHIAAASAQSGAATLLVNGHLRSSVVVSRLRQAQERATAVSSAPSGELWLASWWSLPWPDELRPHDWHADGARVLVLDTIDEMLVTHARAIDRSEWLHMLRHLRRRAEELSLTVIVTVRLPSTTKSQPAAQEALSLHPAGEALVDVSDVVAYALPHCSSFRTLEIGFAHNRLGPTCSVQLPVGTPLARDGWWGIEQLDPRDSAPR